MPYVYRYISSNDETDKYIGIIKRDNNFPGRFIQHKTDDWYGDDVWIIKYTYVPTITDAEALEGHFIAKYQTWKYYNKSKASWGECSFAPTEYLWEIYNPKEVKKEDLYETIKRLEARLEAVEKKTEEEVNRQGLPAFRTEIVANFLAEKTMPAKRQKTNKPELYKLFESYCDEKKITEPIGKILFYKALKELKIPMSKDGRTSWVWGLKIKEAV